MHVLGISGSLRQGSYNTALLRAAQAMAPKEMSIAAASIAGIPVYNFDDQQKAIPEPVEALGREIRAADAVLIATPEYNYSIPGGLKNAIDWLSRLTPQPFALKPIALMGASPGLLGSARAQYHLRQSFVFLNGLIMNRPEVFVNLAPSKFDAKGNLTDEPTRKALGALLAGLQDWAAKAKALAG
jgi:chromate reductase